MADINNSLIARLLNYGKVEENTTLEPPKAAGSDSIGSFTFKGRADMPARLTNNMGDNPMVDDTAPEIDERGDLGPVVNDEVLNKVKTILNNIGISDADIAVGNVRLKSAQSCIKLIKQATGKAVDESQATQMCAEIVDQLSMKLSEDLTADDNEELNEFFDMPADSRFTFTIDALGNVQLNDTQAGTGVLLRGQDAVEFLGKMEMEGQTPEDQQKVLAYYQHVMESNDNQSIDEDVAVGDYFGASQAAVDTLSSMNDDLRSMKDKLKTMHTTAMQNSDVQGKMAAEHFMREIQTFAASLHQYIDDLTN